MATGIQGGVNYILPKGQKQDCAAITELWSQWHWCSIKVVMVDKG